MESLHEILGLETLAEIEILDIGALSEGTDRYQRLVDLGQARITGFEPNPAEYERLSRRGHPYSYIPKFLGDGNAHTLRIARYPGCSSLFAPDPAIIDMFSTIGATEDGDNFRTVETHRVETTRLDDIEELRAPDYVKIDVQGAELMVLENGARTLGGTMVLECEVEFLPLYKGQPLFGEIQAFLQSQGFMVHKLIEVAGRSYRPMNAPNPFEPISQILWADAVFVRDVRGVANWPQMQILKAATVLHEVYLSYDLVNYLLLALDRQRGPASDLSLRYLRRLTAETALPNLYLTQRLQP
ncbi:MAG: FkbM family methyltransferase [Telmatospirillum sp.]|nr:FkbM family methyltransferase [Telmatospirillum sp.]